MRRAITALLSLLILTGTMCAQSVGLVLSGGGAKGITHIGIIQALEENGIPIDYITGTSCTKAYFHKEPFVAIDPFIGCDYIVSEKLHLTLKIDYLNGIGGKELYLPTGPRAYIGFIFCH